MKEKEKNERERMKDKYNNKINKHKTKQT